MENKLSFQSNTGIGEISPKIYGEGKGPVLIFIHGIKDQSSRYIPFAESNGCIDLLFHV